MPPGAHGTDPAWVGLGLRPYGKGWESFFLLFVMFGGAVASSPQTGAKKYRLCAVLRVVGMFRVPLNMPSTPKVREIHRMVMAQGILWPGPISQDGQGQAGTRGSQGTCLPYLLLAQDHTDW